MKWKTILCTSVIALVGGNALAVEGDSSATQVTEAERPEISEPTNMRNQRFSVGPQLGFVNYTDNTGEKSTRGTVGVLSLIHI